MTHVVKPNTLTLLSTNAAHTCAAWSAATSYTVGDYVYLASTNRVYECLVAGVNATSPDVSALEAVPRWLDYSPTNPYAVMDEQVNTRTYATTQLVFTVATGPATAIALFGIVNAYEAVIEARSSSGGTLVYTRTVNLDGTKITDWYEYFFELYVPKPEVILTDLPPYYNAAVTITLTGVTGAQVGCGVVIAGKSYAIGTALHGAAASINDYSRKETDEFGITTFVRRAYSKRMSLKTVINNTLLNKVQYVLAEVRATPCAWLGVPVAGYDPLNVFGFYKSFDIEIQYADYSQISIEIEGLI
jgi:hypothetical protein